MNPGLHISGVILTMFDQRNRLSAQVEGDAREHLADVVFDTIIPRNVRVSEAPSFGMPISDYDPNSRSAKAYKELALEFLKKVG